MDKHVTVVAVLRIGLSVIMILAAIFIFVFLFGIGWILSDDVAQAILTFVGIVVGILLVIIGLPGLLGGIGLLSWQPWARILILIVSAMDLINVPVGTILGAYSIWVLTNDETEALFKRDED